MDIDLDAARAARQEKRGDLALILAGHRYALKPFYGFDAAEAWASAEPRRILEAVLADPTEADEFLATPGVGWPELNAVVEAYGLTAGESSAS